VMQLVSEPAPRTSLTRTAGGARHAGVVVSPPGSTQETKRRAPVA
jgi:hypothetical protein